MLIDRVRTALRVAVTDYDAEITNLIQAGFNDLGITDINPELLTGEETEGTELDPLVERAVITYCKANFGYLSTDQYNKFKASYDEQKAQMLMSSGYTEWGDTDA